MIKADLPHFLWPFTQADEIHVPNRVPNSTLGTTPFYVITGSPPCLKSLRVFGCATYMLQHPRGPKFESRTLEGVYLETR